MKLEWKKSIQIQDGMHQGKIIRIENRTEPYEYTDIVIKLLDDDLELRYGCPTILSENSKLGSLLQRFGAKAEIGKEIELEPYLIGKIVSFMTLTKKTKDGKEFAEIVKDSLKPETQKI